MPSRTLRLPALILLLSTTLATGSPTPCTNTQCHHHPSKITWGSCEGRGFDTFNRTELTCGDLYVPLDYTSNSSETIRLELVRMPAKTQPAKGTIQINFGGPGEPSRESFAAAADWLQDLSGGEFDLLVFDPRGTGTTIPFSCYGPDDEAQRIISTVLSREVGRASDTSLGRLWAMGKVVADDCYKRMGEMGKYIGTSFYVRDIVQVAEALGGEEAGLVRYWGMSYGSIVGAVLASMFPDRIESMLLDGIVNPHEYFDGWNLDFLEDADAVLDGFFASCFYRNQTEPCTLALHYPSASAAKEAFVDFMETDLKYNPLPAGPYLIEYGNVKDAVFQFLYMPRFWPTILKFVYAIMTRDLTVLLDGEGTEYTSFASVIANYERKAELEDIILDRTVGIWCADKPDRIHSATLEEVKPVVEQMRVKSWISGDGLPLRFTTRCAHWNMPAKERVNPLKVDGPPVKTKKPVLLVGTSYDPATPMASAFNMSAGLEGSVVLRHNGYGHTLFAEISLCSTQVVQAYFTNGTLPAPGTVCEPDWPVVPSPWERSDVVRRASYTEEEEALVRAAKGLGEILDSRRGFL